MQALILAAGTGSRLLPLTQDRPKCMVEFCGKPLLEWQLDSLRDSGIEEISIVTGYQDQFIKNRFQKEFNKIYHNENYLTTNMVSSFLLAQEIFDKDLLVLYSDILYSPEIVKKISENKDDFAVVVDKDWLKLWGQRFANPLLDAETLKVSDGNIIEIGQKTQNMNDICGQYIGVMKFSKWGLEKIMALYQEAVEEINHGQLAWGVVNNLKQAYMTDLLMGLIKKGHQLKEIPIHRGWIEIDSFNDYLLYSQNFSKNNQQFPFEIFN